MDVWLRSSVNTQFFIKILFEIFNHILQFFFTLFQEAEKQLCRYNYLIRYFFPLTPYREWNDNIGLKKMNVYWTSQKSLWFQPSAAPWMVQNCQSIINQLALAIGQAKLRRELLLFKNHPNVPIMSKKITNSICIFRLLKLNQEERSLLRSHSWWLMDDVIVIICHLNSSNLLLYMYSTSSTRRVHVLNYYLVWS